MTGVALIAAVIASLTHPAAGLTCGLHPTQADKPEYLQGAAQFTPAPRIWLESCKRTAEGDPVAAVVLAHEIIHIREPDWPHWKVYRWDNWYAEAVVSPKLERFRDR